MSADTATGRGTGRATAAMIIKAKKSIKSVILEKYIKHAYE
jgi:hypothetical protein